MARFASNKSLQAPGKSSSRRITNAAGGTGYAQSAKLELVSLMLTSFLGDEAYRSSASTLLRLKELVAAVPRDFAAKAALYARDQFGMRSVTHVVAAEIAKTVKGESWTKGFYERVVIRPDDAIEILACYLSTYGRPIPNSLKRGLGRAIGRFSEHQLAKYKGNGPFRMVDVVNLVRPAPTPAITKLMTGKLAPAGTWEVEMSAAGQAEDADENKAQVWLKLLQERKLGYLAALRNIRNIAQQSTAAAVDMLCELLMNADLCRKARIFPYQIQKAYEQLPSIDCSSAVRRQLSAALTQAMDNAVRNIPVFEGRAAILLDTSGSMQGQPAEIGSVFAAALAKAWDADLVSWSSSAKDVNYNRADSVMTIAKAIPFQGGGTNLGAAFNKLSGQYGRVVVLSDMQTWMDGSCGAQPAWRSYCSRSGCKPHLYSFDLKNYGSMVIPEDRVYCLAGYSEKVFDIMDKLEGDKAALVHAVEAVSLE